MFMLGIYCTHTRPFARSSVRPSVRRLAYSRACWRGYHGTDRTCPRAQGVGMRNGRYPEANSNDALEVMQSQLTDEAGPLSFFGN